MYGGLTLPTTILGQELSPAQSYLLPCNYVPDLMALPSLSVLKAPSCSPDSLSPRKVSLLEAVTANSSSEHSIQQLATIHGPGPVLNPPLALTSVLQKFNSQFSRHSIGYLPMPEIRSEVPSPLVRDHLITKLFPKLRSPSLSHWWTMGLLVVPFDP